MIRHLPLASPQGRTTPPHTPTTTRLLRRNFRLHRQYALWQSTKFNKNGVFEEFKLSRKVLNTTAWTHRKGKETNGKYLARPLICGPLVGSVPTRRARETPPTLVQRRFNGILEEIWPSPMAVLFFVEPVRWG